MTDTTKPPQPWVRLTKLSECPNAGVSASLTEDYAVGELNLLSLPVEYNLEGFLEEPIRVGRPIRVDRRFRNGIQVPGMFESSRVTEVGEDRVQTRNSIYLVEFKDPPVSL